MKAQSKSEYVVVNGPTNPASQGRLIYQVNLPGGFLLTTTPEDCEADGPHLAATDTGLIADLEI